MARVKLGGRELVIDDSELTAYLKKGYAVIDGKGNELRMGKAAAYEQAVAENRELLAKNKRLVADLEELRTESIRLKKELDSTKQQLTQAQTDLDAVQQAQYNSLEASKQAKANKSSSVNKRSEIEDFGLKTAT